MSYAPRHWRWTESDYSYLHGGSSPFKSASEIVLVVDLGEIAEDDRRLIAAAPDLLIALEGLADAILNNPSDLDIECECTHCIHVNKAYHVARKAASLARGDK